MGSCKSLSFSWGFGRGVVAVRSPLTSTVKGRIPRRYSDRGFIVVINLESCPGSRLQHSRPGDGRSEAETF